jgi:hypothetical protein
MSSELSGRQPRFRYPFEQVSPYRDLVRDLVRPVKLVLSRAAWDVSRAGRHSKQVLGRWKDRFAGERAVILCNGPSLLKADLRSLEGTFTFGLNKINLLFDTSAFRPSCVVAVNPLVLEQNLEFYRSTSIPLFLQRRAAGAVGCKAHVAYLHTIARHVFARDCRGCVSEGHTVTFVAMQLAFHMGFRRVALIGCDHQFATQGPANLAVTSGQRDDNHFDPRYFAGGVQWQLPDLTESEIAFVLAKEVFQQAGGELVNATVGGDLTVLPRRTLDDFLGRLPSPKTE